MFKGEANYGFHQRQRNIGLIMLTYHVFCERPTRKKKQIQIRQLFFCPDFCGDKLFLIFT